MFRNERSMSVNENCSLLMFQTQFGERFFLLSEIVCALGKVLSKSDDNGNVVQKSVFLSDGAKYEWLLQRDQSDLYMPLQSNVVVQPQNKTLYVESVWCDGEKRVKVRELKKQDSRSKIAS